MFAETRKRISRERRLHPSLYYPLNREQCTQAIIFACFALSYVARFLLDFFVYTSYKNSFKLAMLSDLVYYVEGLSFLALLELHAKNFKVYRPSLVGGR